MSENDPEQDPLSEVRLNYTARFPTMARQGKRTAIDTLSAMDGITIRIRRRKRTNLGLVIVRSILTDTKRGFC